MNDKCKERRDRTESQTECGSIQSTKKKECLNKILFLHINDSFSISFHLRYEHDIERHEYFPTQPRRPKHSQNFSNMSVKKPTASRSLVHICLDLNYFCKLWNYPRNDWWWCLHLSLTSVIDSLTMWCIQISNENVWKAALTFVCFAWFETYVFLLMGK